MEVFANTLWPRSVWGQPHLVLRVLCPDGDHMLCPVSKCNSFPLSQILWQALTRGEAALTARTAWNPRSSCREELGRNAHLLSPEISSATFLDEKKISLRLSGEIAFTQRTFMNAFTDTVNRDLGLDSVSVYCVESNRLHLCSFFLLWRTWSSITVFSYLETAFWLDYRCMINGLSRHPADTLVIQFQILWQFKGCY